jgi:hypothetical protein
MKILSNSPSEPTINMSLGCTEWEKWSERLGLNPNLDLWEASWYGKLKLCCCSAA